MSVRCDALVWPERSERRCDGCGDALTGRQRRWCSDDCANLYWTNHRFNRAREACRERSVARYRLVEIYGPDGTVERQCYVPTHWRCAHCGRHTPFPEVNHIRPAMGAHAAESCIHHQDNLEVLCGDCHAVVTRRQRRRGPDVEQLELVAS